MPSLALRITPPVTEVAPRRRRGRSPPTRTRVHPDVAHPSSGRPSDATCIGRLTRGSSSKCAAPGGGNGGDIVSHSRRQLGRRRMGCIGATRVAKFGDAQAVHRCRTQRRKDIVNSHEVVHPLLVMPAVEHLAHVSSLIGPHVHVVVVVVFTFRIRIVGIGACLEVHAHLGDDKSVVGEEANNDTRGGGGCGRLGEAE